MEDINKDATRISHARQRYIDDPDMAAYVPSADACAKNRTYKKSRDDVALPSHDRSDFEEFLRGKPYDANAEPWKLYVDMRFVNLVNQTVVPCTNHSTSGPPGAVWSTVVLPHLEQPLADPVAP